jgi:hypothetical protein
VDGRSDFLVDGRSNLREMSDSLRDSYASRLLLFRDSIRIDRHNSFASVASKILNI